MLKTKLIGSLIASATLLSTLAALGGQIVQAQIALRPVSLLKAKCVSSGLGNARENSLNVSIGKAVYTSQFYLGPGNRSAGITCKIKPDKYPEPVFQTLNLGFGMRDNDKNSPPVVVNVYLNGKQAETRTVSPTQTATLPLDVSDTTDVAIEAVCSNQKRYCDRVYFFQASLEPKIPPSLQQQ